MHTTALSESATPLLGESEVQAFVREHNLAAHIDFACRLIVEHFTVSGHVSMEKKGDPELFDEWVSLRVQAAGDVNSVLDAYDAFTNDFVANVPEPIGHKIRLSLGMA